MKTISIAITLALASFSAAQFEGLPDCAKSCATEFLAGGIGDCGTDAKCICANKDFISGISCCLADACDEKDQAAAVKAALQLCNASGVSVPSEVICATATTGSSKGSGSATATSTGSSSGSANGTGASKTGASKTDASETDSSPSSTENFAPRQTAAAGLIGGIVAAVALL